MVINHESNEIWLNIVNEFSDVVVLTDNQGVILKINKAGENFLGTSSEKIIGKSCCKLFHGSKKRISDCPMQKMLQTGQRANSEHCLSGGKWVSITVEPIKDEKGEINNAVHIIRDITQQKQLEKTLKDSEEKFKSIFENATDAITYLDCTGKILDVNKQVINLRNGSKEEVINRHFSNINVLSLKDIPKYLTLFKSVLTGRKATVTVEVYNKKREKRFLECSASLIKSDTGPARIMVISRDITDRKNTENLLRESEQRLRSIIDHSIEMFYIHDTNHQLTYVSPQCKDILDYTPEEMIVKWTTLISDNPINTKGFELTEKAIKTGRKQNTYLLELKRKDGLLRIVEIDESPLKDKKGKVVGITGALRDITQHKHMMDALSESEEKYRSVIENANISVIVIQDGKLVFYNSKFSDMLGYSKKEFEEINFLTKIHEEDRTYTAERIRNRIEGVEMEPEFAQVRVITKSGKIKWVETNSTVIQWEGKTALQSFITDITDRKNAESALAESEEKFKNLAEQSPNMIFINKKGKVVYANKRSSEILGYERDEFYSDGFNFLCLIAPESIEKIRKAFSQHLNEQEVEPYEYALITKEGQRIEAIITTKLIDYEGDKSILGIITDITERKKVENSLRKSEEKWRLLYENLPGGSFVVNKEYIIEDVNDILCTLTGFKREELVGQRCGIICPKGPHKCPIFDLGQTKIDNNETAVKTKDGRLVPILKSARKIPFAEKEVIVESFQDITERKKIEDELKNSESRYHSLFNNANDAIFIMDFDTFVDCNNKTLEIFNCEKEQIVGKKPYGIFSPEMQNDGQNSEEKALEKIQLAHNGKPQFFQWCHLKYDGTPFDAEVSLNPVEIEGKTYLQAQVRDITERKKAEENILRYQNQLKSLASKLTLSEEKERYRIATELHDHISQYLAVSMMKLEELLSISDSEEKGKIIEQINEWLQHAMDESHSLTFDLSSPVLHELGFERAVAAWLEDEVEGKHHIKTVFKSDGLPKPLNDDICVLLFRSVREILFNVIKHAQAKKVKVFVNVIDDNIKIRVEDDGVGFKPDEVAANAFSQSKFGLFSIQERLEHFGGNVEIDSKPGHGCRITLIAPLKNQ